MDSQETDPAPTPAPSGDPGRAVRADRWLSNDEWRNFVERGRVPWRYNLRSIKPL